MNDVQLIYEAYDNMPPQCPQHLLEEGLAHQLHAWVMGKAIPWLQQNKGKIAIAGGIAAALAMYTGMDPDTAQQAVDGLDPEVVDQLSGNEGVVGGVELGGENLPQGDVVSHFKPLNPQETQQLANQYAEQMGVDPNTMQFSSEGGIPTQINGQPVPDNLHSPEHKQGIDMVRSMAGDDF